MPSGVHDENDILVVKERRVLLGIKHLKERTRRIAVVSTTDLVNFINEYERVLSTDALQRLDDLSGKSSERHR